MGVSPLINTVIIQQKKPLSNAAALQHINCFAVFEGLYGLPLIL